MCPLTQRCGTYIKGNATQPLKKKKMLCAAKWMHVEIIIPSERERQMLYDITYLWNLKVDTNELTYKTDSQRKQSYGYQEERSWGPPLW